MTLAIFVLVIFLRGVQWVRGGDGGDAALLLPSGSLYHYTTFRIAISMLFCGTGYPVVVGVPLAPGRSIGREWVMKDEPGTTIPVLFCGADYSDVKSVPLAPCRSIGTE